MTKYEVYEKMKTSPYFLKTLKRVSKDSLYDYYISEGHNLQECCSHFAISSETFNSLLLHYNIIKDDKQRNKERSIKRSVTKTKITNEILSCVDLTELKHLYIDENWSYERIKERYQLSSYMLDKLIRENGLKKPRKQSAQLVLESKYKKAGSKELYDKQILEKTRQSIIQREGSLEEHYNRVASKCKRAWKTKLPQEIEEITAKRREAYYSDVNKIEHAKQIRLETNLEKYGVDNAYKLAVYTGSTSKPNQRFSELLNSLQLEYKQEFFVNSQEVSRGFRYDFKINNTLIEINPWPFHNSNWSPIEGTDTIDKNYHKSKTATAFNNGFRCIHVWDWDSQEKIALSLVDKTTLYARRCVIKEVSKKETNTFLNSYHFQNTCKGQKYCYGLYYNDELVQVMTFGKPRYNKNYEYELLRLCTKFGYKVVGGAEKLYKHFIKTVNPTSIISYCDNSKFTGEVYIRLGMTLKDRGIPTKHWYSDKLKVHITDNFLRQRGFDQLFGEQFGYYGKGISNDELMIQHGFVEIYDCGQSVYIWSNN